MTPRERYEQLEEEILSPHAAKSAHSRGRAQPEPPCDIRTVFQRDRDRILHSKAFRRLSHKTQVFIAPEVDHFRTRLTHTLELAQIARTISRALRLNEDLTEAIALGHDLGHTPFGHAGEWALDAVYREYDLEAGFTHAEQSLRVVEVLEKDGRGLNLTWEVRDGIGAHSKGMGDLPPDPAVGPATLEGWVVLYADRIAYINHDIDDAVHAGLITIDSLPAEATSLLGRTHAQRITTMVSDVIAHSQNRPEITMGSDVVAATNRLKDFLYERVYAPISVGERESERVERAIRSLFQFYMSHPEEFAEGPRTAAQGVKALARAVCDHIAGMTDRFASQQLVRNFLPRPYRIAP